MLKYLQYLNIRLWNCSMALGTNPGRLQEWQRPVLVEPQCSLLIVCESQTFQSQQNIIFIFPTDHSIICKMHSNYTSYIDTIRIYMHRSNVIYLPDAVAGSALPVFLLKLFVCESLVTDKVWLPKCRSFWHPLHCPPSPLHNLQIWKHWTRIPWIGRFPPAMSFHSAWPDFLERGRWKNAQLAEDPMKTPTVAPRKDVDVQNSRIYFTVESSLFMKLVLPSVTKSFGTWFMKKRRPICLGIPLKTPHMQTVFQSAASFTPSGPIPIFPTTSINKHHQLGKPIPTFQKTLSHVFWNHTWESKQSALSSFSPRHGRWVVLQIPMPSPFLGTAPVSSADLTARVGGSFWWRHLSGFCSRFLRA